MVLGGKSKEHFTDKLITVFKVGGSWDGGYLSSDISRSHCAGCERHSWQNARLSQRGVQEK